jgi:hypothetical protein
MKKLEDKIPLDIKIKSKLFPIIDYQKEYGKDDPTINLAKEEIEKINFAEGMKYDVPIIIPPVHWYDENTGKAHSLEGGELKRRFIGERVNRLTWDENRIEYDTIWVHLGRDYFKQISKVYDPRNC